MLTAMSFKLPLTLVSGMSGSFLMRQCSRVTRRDVGLRMKSGDTVRVTCERQSSPGSATISCMFSRLTLNRS